MTLESYTVEHSLSVSCDRPGCGKVISVEAENLTEALDAIKGCGWRLDPNVSGDVLTSCAAFCAKHESAGIQCDGCDTAYPAGEITTRMGGDWCAKCFEKEASSFVEPVPIADADGKFRNSFTAWLEGGEAPQYSMATICERCNTQIAVPMPIPAKFTFERKCPQCGQTYIITAEPDGEDGAKLDIRAKVEEVDT